MLVIVAGALLAIVLVLAACGAGDALRVASSLTAHELCSTTFIAHRDPDAVFGEYLKPFIGVPIVRSLVRYDVDRAHRVVTASVAGLFGARAAYAEGRGCTVVHRPASPAAIRIAPVVGGGALTTALDPVVVAAVEHESAERADRPHLGRKAVIVIAGDRILAERYAPGYDAETPLQSWSMAKSITHALIGALVLRGRLAVDQPAPVAAWRSPGDPHHAITIDHLLRQTSGQPFGQSNSGFDPSSRMQFLEPDTAGVSAAATFARAPGDGWAYTDGNFAILSGIVRDTVGGGPAAVAGFARDALFAPLGMTHVVLEFDEAGAPIGADWVFASARDWARFGLVYASDGVVDGRRVLPAGWASYAASPTLQAEPGYGAGFFTNAGPSPGAVRRQLLGAPPGSFFALGNSGQIVFIVPSHRLVIASLGFSLDRSNRALVESIIRIAQLAVARLDAPAHPVPEQK